MTPELALERRKALARSLHRPPRTLRQDVADCRRSVLAVDAKLASFAAANAELRAFADRVRSTTARLDRALAELAACLP